MGECHHALNDPAKAYHEQETAAMRIELAQAAVGLYGRFRPEILACKAGWGAAGRTGCLGDRVHRAIEVPILEQ